MRSVSRLSGRGGSVVISVCEQLRYFKFVGRAGREVREVFEHSIMRR